MAAITTYGTTGLLATTIANYIPTLEDNVFTSKPLLYILKSTIKQFSGTKIVQPLLYGAAPNVGAYVETDTFATAANSGISAAEFDYRMYYGLTHFTGLELAKNTGKSALLNLVSSRMKQLEMTISENLNTLLFSGTGVSPQWNGLDVIIGTVDNTVGDIDSTTYTWWESTVNATATTLTLAIARRLFNSASDGNDHPTHIVSDLHEFEAYENLIDDNARFLDPKMADAGFQNLMFKGVPWVFDTSATAAHLYMFNTKYLTLAKLADVWFKVSDWLYPTNADVMYKHIRCYGNLICSNRKRHACATALTDA
jgi:hypothetical protein